MSGYKSKLLILVGLLASVLIVGQGCRPKVKIQASDKVPKICESELRPYTYKLQRQVALNPDNEPAWTALSSVYWALGELSEVDATIEAMMSQFPHLHTRLSREKEQLEELNKDYNLEFEGCMDRAVFFEMYENAVNWAQDESAPPPGDLVFLEVSTVPTGAHIIVSDQYLGNSPVRTTVEPGQDITIQAMMQGYEDLVKVVSGEDLVAGRVKSVVLRLVEKE